MAQSACVDSRASTPIAAQETKINIMGVEFRGEDALPPDLQAKLTDNIQHSNISIASAAPDSDRFIELGEVVVKGFLEDLGYLTATVDTTPYLVSSEETRRSYVVALTIETGPQYRLHRLNFEGFSAFEASELRKQIDLSPGDLFNVSKVRGAMDSLTKLYSSRGYIDMTPEPVMKLDKEHQQIDLVLKLDEGKQYRLASFEVLGLGAREEEEALKSMFQSGEPFDQQRLRTLLSENKQLLPDGASPFYFPAERRDTRNGTVDVVLDFRACGGSQKVAARARRPHIPRWPA
jgi:outer membrane protein assembly factor BamA